MNDVFFIKNYVDNQFALKKQIDHDSISQAFMSQIGQEFDDNRFGNLLIISGFIPDLYSPDSSQETLFSKLVECLVAEWANRMGFTSEIVKQKASYEDIKIIIDEKIIVCDAKSFRLGRSQAAPNAKDFLKLEDVRKWMNRYPSSIGGLVTYPCRHEWTGNSDVYQYCSTKNAPTVMLPYKYLAFLLSVKDQFDKSHLLDLWDYNRLFPHDLKKNIKNGNKTAYWNVINNEILRIANVSKKKFDDFMTFANKKILDCVNKNESYLLEKKSEIIRSIKDDIAKESDIDLLKDRLVQYRIKTETMEIEKMLSRIKKFRK